MPERALVLAAADRPWEVSLLMLLAVPALVLLNAFFVAAEFALVAVRRTQVEEMVQQKRRGSGSLRAQVQHLDRYIAATQLGITIASIALGFVGEPALAHLIEPLFSFLPPGLLERAAVHTTAVSLAFLIITFMHVVMGELAPKAMALQRPAEVALWVTVPLEVFTRLTRPVVVVMNGVGNWLVRRLGFRDITGEQMVHSVDELVMIVDEVEEAGLLSADQAAFVQNVFELTEKTVGDCLVPREKMAALELNTPPDKVLEIVRQGAHTRLPVYERELDNIVGIVNTKDLFYLFSLQGVVILQDALYPALFLKPEQPIADALRLFRRSRRPMAVVRNDEGKVLGLITLEDVLEEIVGDIEDEHDRPVPKLRLPRPNAPVRPVFRGSSPPPSRSSGTLKEPAPRGR
jgi:CBS domain containing-hemolysin-like protein